MSTIKVYTCPNCQGHDILVRYPVYVKSRALLNDDEIDAGDLVDDVLEAAHSDASPQHWICTECTEGGDGAPSEVTDVPDDDSEQPADPAEGRDGPPLSLADLDQLDHVGRR
jgi:hypothetical protein